MAAKDINYMFDFENQDSVLNYDSKQFKRSPDDTVIITDKDPTMFMLTYCTAAIIFNATTQQSILFHYTPAWGPQTHSENKLKIDEFLKILDKKSCYYNAAPISIHQSIEGNATKVWYTIERAYTSILCSNIDY